MLSFERRNLVSDLGTEMLHVNTQSKLLNILNRNRDETFFFAVIRSDVEL